MAARGLIDTVPWFIRIGLQIQNLLKLHDFRIPKVWIRMAFMSRFLASYKTPPPVGQWGRVGVKWTPSENITERLDSQ